MPAPSFIIARNRTHLLLRESEKMALLSRPTEQLSKALADEKATAVTAASSPQRHVRSLLKTASTACYTPSCVLLEAHDGLVGCHVPDAVDAGVVARGQQLGFARTEV